MLKINIITKISPFIYKTCYNFVTGERVEFSRVSIGLALNMINDIQYHLLILKFELIKKWCILHFFNCNFKIQQ